MRLRGLRLRWVRGLCVLAEAVAGVVIFVSVVADVVVDVVVGVLHPWLVRGAAGTGTTTRVPAVGSVVALPDARLLARAARVSAIAWRSSRTVDAPQPPTWRAKCRFVTPTYRGWSVYRREFVRGLNTEVTQIGRAHV